MNDPTWRFAQCSPCNAQRIMKGRPFHRNINYTSKMQYNILMRVLYCRTVDFILNYCLQNKIDLNSSQIVTEFSVSPNRNLLYFATVFIVPTQGLRLKVVMISVEAR